ncbi:hypothetical protein MO867_04475 [Microbulbifer sp. OS29]|uniref:Uncharacterized protein n=1 Tax=Microbulbifer okhotskensis TaxID=2926617 RepID=A0A9X2EQ79_9GAMM|nr:hypothetical protein [Microbulbifer okhotskensis]MCO1333591.1 hypothetical protein [Microbulbifer okhotskensis]
MAKKRFRSPEDVHATDPDTMALTTAAEQPAMRSNTALTLSMLHPL